MLYLITIFPFHFFYILFRFSFVCVVNFLYGDAVVFTVLYTLIIGSDLSPALISELLCVIEWKGGDTAIIGGLQRASPGME